MHHRCPVGPVGVADVGGFVGSPNARQGAMGIE